MKHFGPMFIAAWIVSALIGLCLISVCVWAVISLVNHITG